MSKSDPNIMDELIEFADNLKCCANCLFFYDCGRKIVDLKIGKGICIKWVYDKITNDQRRES
jgi:hypothetical protein